ncbi:MAG: glycosyltransferase family 2 protein [Candidatus Pacebacteria bacterium]|nr:glycosyltransferase family 2 protein [Candidatus Paceibacterota bacterium]
MDHISIVIVHYNTEKETKECLDSLEKIKTNQNFKYDVILLDNASKIPLKLKKNYTNFELIRSDSNLGFTGGNNLAVKYALEKHNSDYILLLNNDTIVDPDFLKNLYKCSKDHPKAGLVTPKIYFEKNFEFYKQDYPMKERGNVIWYAGGSIDWKHLSADHRGVDEVDYGQFEDVSKVDFTTGCCLLISREIVETVGLLDDNLFLYSEDVDYSLRVKKAGYDLLYCPQSVIWHKNAGSSGGSGSPVQNYYQTRNRLWIAKRHGDYRAKYIAFRLILRIIFGKNEVEKEALNDFITNNMGKKPVIL